MLARGALSGEAGSHEPQGVQIMLARKILDLV